MDTERTNRRSVVIRTVLVLAVFAPLVYLFSYHPLLSVLPEPSAARATFQWAYAPVRCVCNTDPFFEPMQRWARLWGVQRRRSSTNNLREIAAALREAERKAAMARLEVSLRGTRADPTLVVTLHNVSRIPLVYDRELVFLLEIVAVSPEGVSVPPEEIRSVTPEEDNPEAFKERFVHLLPGESASREIRLRQGFKMFVVASSDTGRVSAYEAVERVADLDGIERFDVSYRTSLDFDFGLSQYTGLEPSELNLYEGPRTQTVLVADLEM